MASMSFMPQLKEFLLKNGHIYTVRKYRMDHATVYIEGVGECTRIPKGIISSKEDLRPYLEFSGFSHLEDWWSKIEHFIPDRDSTMYLYRVDVEC